MCQISPFFKLNQNAKVISVGEILLRLTVPDHGRLDTADSFAASFAGSEANVAASLANLGVESAVFTVLPDNSLGRGVIRMLRSHNVDCSRIILSTAAETPGRRLGVYYLETGFGVRPSRVVYDRAHSAISEYDFSRTDLEQVLSGYDWLHLSGVTPALGQNCRDLTLRCLQTAKRLGMTVSFVWLFRSALWTWEDAREFCTQCLPYTDVLSGIEPFCLWKDENDHAKGDVKDGLPLQLDYERQHEVFRAFAARYPNLQVMARHVRTTHSASKNSLMAYLWCGGCTYESKTFTFDILDRVGGGDAFDSGLIYALLKGFAPADAVNFAVASSVMKHTIHGDINTASDARSILNLMTMNYDISR